MISVIIPVYNRPTEVDDILKSLCAQDFAAFEVVIVEDGSSVDCQSVVESYSDRLSIKYIVKENGGPGPARNFGAKRASGDFFIFLDSDCIVPPTYMGVVSRAVESGVMVFGGPDMADADFTSMQRAVSYSMTSFFTTGGIRGGKRKLDRFIPRSFNMGVAKELYQKVEGFSPMRFGEDIDISMRLITDGAVPVLLLDAAVYHKRRTNMKAFFRQVFFSGVARINLYKRHPHSLKAVHAMPACFTLGSLICLLLALWSAMWLLPLIAIAMVWFVSSWFAGGSVKVGGLSILTSFIQLYGYGIGFFYGVWKRLILGASESETYKTNFF